MHKIFCRSYVPQTRTDIAQRGRDRTHGRFNIGLNQRKKYCTEPENGKIEHKKGQYIGNYLCINRLLVKLHRDHCMRVNHPAKLIITVLSNNTMRIIFILPPVETADPPKKNNPKRRAIKT